MPHELADDFAVLEGTADEQPPDVVAFDGMPAGAPMDPTAEPPEPYPPLPGFPFMHQSASAIVVGPTGGGRSSLMQAGAYDAARAGLSVAYISGEVTLPEFNARAAKLAQDRRGDDITDELVAQLAAVTYYRLAEMLLWAWEYPDRWAAAMRARYRIVILDPLSSIQENLELDFTGGSPDYGRFYTRLIQPLVDSELAVLIPDNVGHAEDAQKRASGTAAKGHKADLTFWTKAKADPKGLLIVAEKTRSERCPHRRGDSWEFDDATRRITYQARDDDSDGPFRPTVLMQRVSRHLIQTPGQTRTAVREGVQGKAKSIGTAVDRLLAEGFIETRLEAGNERLFSRHPFPRNEERPETPRSPHSSAVPQPVPTPPGTARSPRSPDLGGERGNGAPLAHPNGTPSTHDRHVDVDDAKACPEHGTANVLRAGRWECDLCEIRAALK